VKLLADLYWPPGASHDPLVVAEKRVLAAFLVITGCGFLAVATIYFQRNAGSYPGYATGAFVAAAAALLAPIWTSQAASPKRAAVFILLMALAVNTTLGSWIDGLISVKALLFLPLSMAVMLILGIFAGLLSGLYSLIVLVSWHVFRDEIGGNLAGPMPIDELSLMLLIGLSLALVMLLAGAAIYRAQLLTVIKLAAATRQDAEISSRAKSILLANVSHELRTPMSGITGLASSLLRTPLSETQRNMADQISHSGLVLDRLLGDLLDYAALQSGGIDIRPDPFKPREMMDLLAQTFRMRAEAKGIAFGMKAEPSLDRPYLGDPVRIGQVVSNLLANAVKFTHRGGVEVEAHVEAAYGATDRPALVVRVADTGIGIAPEARERIFGAFEQAAVEAGPRHEGVGLGLSISKALLDRMGGRIALESTPGHGSIFTIHVPLNPWSEAAGRPSASASSETRGSLAGKSVLVIEDSPAHRTLVGAMLDAFGATTIVARSGEEGIARHAAGGIDVILVDLNLPDMDGIEVINRILRAAGTAAAAGVPILATSADGSGRREAEALQAGASQLLSKPISPDQLYRSLNAALGGGGDHKA
jgi:signal transduction histidine kinase/CheY-like chemotaxis protein